MKHRSLVGLVFLCLLLAGLTLPIAAGEAVTLPPSYTDMADSLPSEIVDLLPDGLFSSDLHTALNAASALSKWDYLLDVLLSAIGLRLCDAVGLFCTLSGLSLLAAVLGRLREGLSGTSGDAFGFCLRLALYTLIATQSVGAVTVVQSYFEELGRLVSGMIPSVGVLYALGGNMGEAAVSGEILGVLLVIVEFVSVSLVPPLSALSMSFALLDAFGTRVSLSSLAAKLKQWYTTLLGALMFLFSLALSAQSLLVGRADTLGMKGVKYAVSTLLPVVGIAVSGTLPTVAAGVSALRGVCGVSGILLLALLLLPTLVELLLLRATVSLSATVASLLGCDGEARLMGEMVSLYGHLAATVAICSLTFAVALALFVSGGVALA